MEATEIVFFYYIQDHLKFQRNIVKWYKFGYQEPFNNQIRSFVENNKIQLNLVQDKSFMNLKTMLMP